MRHRDRHPAGTPSGGQFSTSARNEADVELYDRDVLDSPGRTEDDCLREMLGGADPDDFEPPF